MIISASRRTDIPSFYMDWFCLRLRERFVSTRNPMNPKQVKRIALSPSEIDGIVFWTKNPSPMLSRLPELSRYPYYVQCTVTGYGSDIEPGLPDKANTIIPAFQRLSDTIGPDRIIWRYDPVLICNTYPVKVHCEQFEAIANSLFGYTKQCVISFIDRYAKIEKRMQRLGIRECTEEETHAIAASFSQTAKSHQMRLSTCAEAIDLDAYGIDHARCVDAQRLERISGKPVRQKKDPNQRLACGCAQSVDIGAYNTCVNGCVYCYANHSPAAALRYHGAHDIHSPFL